MDETDVAWPLTAPRGRWLCWALACSLAPGGLGTLAWWKDGLSEADEPALLESLTRVIDSSGLLERTPDDIGRRLLGAVDDATTSGMYWQPPHPPHTALAFPRILEALRPVADLVTRSAPSWWSSPLDLTRQRMVEWTRPEGVATGTRVLTGAPARLVDWHAAALAAEREATSWVGDVSGAWWSTPAHACLPTTTHELPDLGAVGLLCVEDGFGWDAAHCVPVAPTRAPRVYEIDGPADWARLVRRYPLDVTTSRRYVWRETTGADGPWLMPDYLAVGADFDAVHLSVRGHLTTAGAAVPVGDVPGLAGDWRTLLGGWNPDDTYWLTDCLERTGPARPWELDRTGPADYWVPSAG